MKRPAKRESTKPSKRKVRGREVLPVEGALESGAEHRLLNSAWKETLADLTPGLAHDFNNVLTAILTVSEVCLAQMEVTHPFHEAFSLIKQKTHDASQLVYRIARLHQETPGCRDYQDVNAIGAEVVEVLRKVIAKRIEISATFSDDTLPVYVDAVEFRRVLVSLALSAVHAMPGAGKLHFQTSRHNNFPALREVAGELPRLPAACLTLADSGNGLNRKPFTILSEPFPLTRESGNGTGFNFHRARLFLENSRGALSAESSPGTGTTIRLWLPQADFTEAEQANAPAGATL